MKAIEVANEPHVNNRHSSYVPNPKLSFLKFHTTFASTFQNVYSLVFVLFTSWRLSWYTIVNKSFLWHTIAIVVNSRCLKVCTMRPTCFNTWHQIFMFDNRKTTFTFKFHLSSNIPPCGKREVFTSFTLIACNVALEIFGVLLF